LYIAITKIMSLLKLVTNHRGESFSKFLLLVTNQISRISLWRIIRICRSSI